MAQIQLRVHLFGYQPFQIVDLVENDYIRDLASQGMLDILVPDPKPTAAKKTAAPETKDAEKTTED